MYDREFTRLVKIAVETLKEETIYQMVQQSVEYQKRKRFKWFGRGTLFGA